MLTLSTHAYRTWKNVLIVGHYSAIANQVPNLMHATYL
jgi:hypothetical protein